MKRMMIVMAIVLISFAGQVEAKLSDWIDLAPFPNGQVNLLYDFAVSQPGAAGTFSLLESNKFCLDLRIGYMATKEENNIGLLGIGVNIDKIDWISNTLRDLVSSIGGFVGRDFTAGIWRYGVYAVIFKIGKENEEDGDDQ